MKINIKRVNGQWQVKGHASKRIQALRFSSVSSAKYILSRFGLYVENIIL